MEFGAVQGITASKRRRIIDTFKCSDKQSTAFCLQEGAVDKPMRNSYSKTFSYIRMTRKQRRMVSCGHCNIIRTALSNTAYSKYPDAVPCYRKPSSTKVVSREGTDSDSGAGSRAWATRIRRKTYAAEARLHCALHFTCHTHHTTRDGTRRTHAFPRQPVPLFMP
jgi:hypothetical protein